jgi:hypothetical protein
MSESGNDYELNDQNKFQMYEVFNTEVSNQVQEPQVNIVEEKRAKEKTNRHRERKGQGYPDVYVYFP